MPLIDQHEIISLEGVDGDGLVAHLVIELVDIEDFNPLAGEKPAAVLLEQFGGQAGGFKLAQMLAAQALIRGQQEDAIELAPPSVLFEAELVLQDVGVHQQRLAAARRAPIGDLVDLPPSLGIPLEGRDVVALRLVRIADSQLGVDRRQQRLGIAEVSVEIDLGEQQGQILEIFPHDRRLATRDPALVQPQCVLHDVLVVFEKQLSWQLG